MTAGPLSPTVIWMSFQTGQVIKGKLLKIMYQIEYRCIANSTCGSVSTTVFINVQSNANS